MMYISKYISLVNFIYVTFSLTFTIAVPNNQGIQFDGDELLTVDLTSSKVAAENNRISFRLKTISSFGLILYSRGTQGDYIVIDIVQGSLRLVIYTLFYCNNLHGFCSANNRFL